MTEGVFKKFLPCTFTESALREIKEIIFNKKVPEGYGLRVGIKGGGCGGVSYMLGFDQENGTDVAYEVEGVPVFIDKKHVMFLSGLQIDFEDGVNMRGFIFNAASA